MAMKFFRYKNFPTYFLFYSRLNSLKKKKLTNFISVIHTALLNLLILHVLENIDELLCCFLKIFHYFLAMMNEVTNIYIMLEDKFLRFNL